MQTPEERYQTDPHFHMLVDVLTNAIAQAQYTPSELREAALLAAIHYEMRYVRRHFIQPDPLNTALDDWANEISAKLRAEQEAEAQHYRNMQLGPADLSGLKYYTEPEPSQKKLTFWLRRPKANTGETIRLDKDE